MQETLTMDSDDMYQVQQTTFANLILVDEELQILIKFSVRLPLNYQ